MSGHSKWATIKRAKGIADKKRGQVFSKLSREISLAAKNGSDPTMNFRLRLVLDRAKDAGVPKDVIERAVKRGSGEGQEGQIEEALYEGYGPFATAFLIEVATDSKNRTANNIKHIFSEHGGNMGSPGSVAWQFATRGQILVERNNSGDLSNLELTAIDAGAEDVRESPEGLEVYTLPVDLEKIKQILLVAGAKIAEAQVIKESSQGVDLSAEQKQKIEALVQSLENDEDVIAVHTSANL